MKYQILTNQNIQFKHPIKGLPIKLFRIIALKDFVSQGLQVREGDIGGFIQSEKNLSQEDSSWVTNLAKIFDNAQLVDSRVKDDVMIFGDSNIDDSIISHKVRIFGSPKIKSCHISDNVDVYDKAILTNCSLHNSSVVCGQSSLTECELFVGSRISGESIVSKTKLFDQSEIKGRSKVNNCIFKGRTVISNSTLSDEVREEQIELNVITGNA